MKYDVFDGRKISAQFTGKTWRISFDIGTSRTRSLKDSDSIGVGMSLDSTRLLAVAVKGHH